MYNVTGLNVQVKSVNFPSDPLNGRRFQKMKEKRLVLLLKRMENFGWSLEFIDYRTVVKHVNPHQISYFVHHQLTFWE